MAQKKQAAQSAPDFIPAEAPDFIPADSAPASGTVAIRPELRGNLVRNASPTQFEVERNPDFQPGWRGAIADLASGVVKSIPSLISSAQSPQDRAIIGQPPESSPSFQQGRAAAEEDQRRKQAGASIPYRAAAVAAGPLLDVPSIEHAADVGDTGYIAGATAPQAIAAAAPLAKTVIGKVGDATGALRERTLTNPNELYHRYLDPVAETPAPLPELTPRVKSALIKKVEINYPQIARRMVNGTTTIGDLDQIRQVAWTAGKSAVSAIGRPTEMSGGFMRAHDAIASTLYPQIEQAHGLPSGSIGEMKMSVGRLQNTKPILGKLGEVPGKTIGIPEAIGQSLKPLTAATIPGRAVAKIGRYAVEGGRTAAQSLRLPQPRP